MTGRPTPERRYEDDERQRAYAAGFAQARDHDSHRMADWIEHAVSHEHALARTPNGDDEAHRCELRAAAWEGAADLLLELADRAYESAVLWRTPDGSDST